MENIHHAPEGLVTIRDDLEHGRREAYRGNRLVAVIARDQCGPCVEPVRFLINLGEFGEFEHAES